MAETGALVYDHVIRKWDMERAENPDLLYYARGSFTIDDAHLLHRWGATRPAREKVKVCCVETYSLTDEAQNALLKLFEDPPEHVRFFLLIPTADILLSTLASRVARVHVAGSFEGEGIDVDSFLGASIVTRYEYLSSFIENGDKAAIHAFLDRLEERLCECEDPDARKFARTLPRLKRMNAGQTAPVRMILEHVIHFTPVLTG